jgi:hypothetical protein
VFCAGVRFFGSVFEDAADFAGARFDAQLELSGAKLNGSADFRGESLEECAFTGTSFRGPAQFDGATSADEVSSLELSATLRTRRSLATSASGVSCRGELDLEAATFENRIALGPMRLDDTTFNRSVHVEVSAARVTCDGATFHGGAELLLGGADVSLGGNPVRRGLARRRDSCAARHGRHPACHLAARGRRVAPDPLGVDLRPCRFAGANGLDGVRLQDVRLPEPPRSRPGRWWARRQTLAEEHHWRAQEGARAAGWYPEAVRPPSWLRPEPVVPTASELAGVYRALRKVTAAGHVIQLVLRIVGPVLVALAILSVRARVRR